MLDPAMTVKSTQRKTPPPAKVSPFQQRLREKVFANHDHQRQCAWSQISKLIHDLRGRLEVAAEEGETHYSFVLDYESLHRANVTAREVVAHVLAKIDLHPDTLKVEERSDTVHFTIYW